MAIIKQKESKIMQEYQYYHNRSVLFKTLCGICFALWALNIIVWHLHEPLFLVPVFFGFGGFAAIARYYNNKAKTLEAGLEGEEHSLNILSGLPEDYTVFPNLQIEANGQQAEIDHLVVGSNGVFIVETKNYTGTLSGCISDKQLSKEKNGYTKILKNPVSQVNREIHVLKQVLSKYQCDHYINGIIYFSNPDFIWDVTGENPWVHVVLANSGGGRELKEIIQEDAGHSLNPAKRSQIIRCLQKERV